MEELPHAPRDLAGPRAPERALKAALVDARIMDLMLPYPTAKTTAMVAERYGQKPRRVNAAVTQHRNRATTPSFFSFVLNKKCGCVVHKHGDEDRANPISSVYDSLPPGFPQIPHVGRLDQESEGLLLFTEDGLLADALLTGGVPKTYHVLVKGLGERPSSGSLARLAAAGQPPSAALSAVLCAVDPGCNRLSGARPDDEASITSQASWEDVQLSLLRSSMRIDGAATLPASVSKVCPDDEDRRDGREVSTRGSVSGDFQGMKAASCEDIFDRQGSTLPRSGSGTWLQFILHEGRNRQIRRLCSRSGLQVERLLRVQFGPLTLQGIAPGNARALVDDDVVSLYAMAGLQQPTPVALPLPLPLPQDHDVSKQVIAIGAGQDGCDQEQKVLNALLLLDETGPELPIINLPP